ncbi:hypothetical protein [Burkholderia contaminans]|uniref:hypothetical protein n=1 Tax=Burkholderia contaminans TaxID=488447 RepID=UPI00241610DB|nr:hypothetical protein [Burkholderia contaminans]WFN14860.1 hypothetical protein LXE92_31910 [Burkholderia contaminans]
MEGELRLRPKLVTDGKGAALWISAAPKGPASRHSYFIPRKNDGKEGDSDILFADINSQRNLNITQHYKIAFSEEFKIINSCKIPSLHDFPFLRFYGLVNLKLLENGLNANLSCSTPLF